MATACATPSRPEREPEGQGNLKRRPGALI